MVWSSTITTYIEAREAGLKKVVVAVIAFDMNAKTDTNANASSGTTNENTNAF